MFKFFKIPKLAKQLRQSYLPCNCLLCNSLQTESICAICQGLHLKWPQSNCAICGFCLRKTHYLAKQVFEQCPDCATTNFAFNKTLALLDYNALSKPLINQIKQGNTFMLKQLLNYFSQQLLEKHVLPDAITYVPSTTKKYIKRGFNASYTIAKQLSKQLNIPFVDLFIKLDDIHLTQQKELNKQQRFKQISQQFYVKDAQIIEQFNDIAIVDDVMTSGATIHILASLLKQAKPQNLSIQAWVLARTSL